MNPVFITIGNFELRYYTLIVLIVVFLGIGIMQAEAKRFNVKKDFIFNMCFWMVIFGLLGARAYFVIFNWGYYSNNIREIFQTWHGGLAIHGGIIVGIIVAYLYCKKYKARFLRYMDFGVVALLFAQAVGRWGNFFNGEAHGVETTASQIQNWFTPNFVVQGMNIDGVYYIPTFYYEFLASIGLLILLLIFRRFKGIKVGTISALYLIGHGAIRFLIEASRTDSLMIGGFMMAQIVSVIMIFAGLIILMNNFRKGKFEDLYNDPNNIEKNMF